MGVQLPGRSGRRRAARKTAYVPMSQINVTPFVDVMLVLLVVFMITAPLLTPGVPVSLPESEAKPLQQDPEEPIEITVNQDYQLFIGDTPIDRSKLIPLLQAMTKSSPERQIYIRGDRSIDYGHIAALLGTVSGAGFKKISLVTAPQE